MKKWIMVALLCIVGATATLEAWGRGGFRGHGRFRGGVVVAGPSVSVGFGVGPYWDTWYTPWNSFAATVAAGTYLTAAASENAFRNDVRGAIRELTNAVQGLVRVVGDQGAQINKLQQQLDDLKK